MIKNIFRADFLFNIDRQFIIRNNINVLLGGPPFIKYSLVKKLYKNSLIALKRIFLTARYGQYDLYMLFVEHAILLLETSGLIYFSLSSSFLHNDNGKIIRSIVSTDSRIYEIIEIEDYEIYASAVTRIALLFLSAGEGYKERKNWMAHYYCLYKTSNYKSQFESLYKYQNILPGFGYKKCIADSLFRKKVWNLKLTSQAKLNKKNLIPLSELPLVLSRGITTFCDSVFILRPLDVRSKKHYITCKTRDGETFPIERKILRPIIRGRNIRGFASPEIPDVCIYPFDDCNQLLSEEYIQYKYPLLYSYFLSKYHILLGRNWRKRWYGFAPDVSTGKFPRLITSNISMRRKTTLISDNHVVLHDSSFAFKSTSTAISLPLLYIFFNSDVFWDQVKSIMLPAKEGYVKMSFPKLRNILVPKTIVSGNILFNEQAMTLVDRINKSVATKNSRNINVLLDELDSFVLSQM